MEIKLDKEGAAAVIETCNKLLGEEPPLASSVGLSVCMDFIKAKITDAEKAVAFRDDSEKTWRGGTDASWRAAGCFDSKEQRLKTSESHGRIAVRCRRELEILKSVLAHLQTLNTKPSHEY